MTQEHNKHKPYIISPFTWSLHFALYLKAQRSDIPHDAAYNLAKEYIELLPNLLTVSPYEVVDAYLEGEYP